MATPKTIQWSLEAHTQAKHLILRRYLEAWLPIMARHHGRIVFVDGFAGPGRYAGGEEGSPLMAIQTLLDHPHFQTAPNSLQVSFLFTEDNPDRFAALTNELHQIQTPEWISVQPVQNKFVPAMTMLLDDLAVQGSVLAPTFAFIDPFGFSDTPMELVRRILSNARCECLITFMFESVNRFLAHPDPGIQHHFDGLFGTPGWRGLLDLPAGAERRDAIVELYRSQLQHMAGAEYVRTFEMVNDGNRTEYFLYFATHSLTGLRKMKEAMWRADPAGGQLFSDRTNPNQMVLIQPTFDSTELSQLLVDRFRGQGAVPIETITHFVLVETPFSETIHLKRRTLAPMERDYRIQVVRPGGARRIPGQYPRGTTVRFLS